MNSPLELGFDHRFIPARLPKAEHGPVLLLLHGTGGDGDSLLQLGQTLSPSSPLLAPTGRVRENGSPRFFRRLSEGVFDLDDLRTRTRELATFIRAAAAAYDLELSRMVAVGYSNGANIAASLLLSGYPVLAGALLFRAMVPFEPAAADATRGSANVPVLLSSGDTDPIATPVQTTRLAALLIQIGARVEEHREAAGHQLTMGDVRHATDWLTRTFEV